MACHAAWRASTTREELGGNNGLLLSPHIDHGGFNGGPGRDDLLLDLGRVWQDEGSGGEVDVVDRSEGAEIDGPVLARIAIKGAAELPPEVLDQMDVGPGLTEDRLPDVSDGLSPTWLADLTYIWTAECWLYVAVVLDFFS